MTLSQFLREYLYIPLGGNRKGPVLRYVNLLITMLLGGLWHGANWTFVIWGGLHGLYLCLNHFWMHISGGSIIHSKNKFKKVVGTLLTFIAVVFAWVFFKAENVATALTMIKCMTLVNGIALPVSLAFLEKYTTFLPLDIKYIGIFYGLSIPRDITSLTFWFVISFFVIWGLPNSQQLLETARVNSASNGRLILAGASFGLLFAFSLLSFSRVSEFLYFQF